VIVLQSETGNPISGAQGQTKASVFKGTVEPSQGRPSFAPQDQSLKLQIGQHIDTPFVDEHVDHLRISAPIDATPSELQAGKMVVESQSLKCTANMTQDGMKLDLQVFN
jgi:hypothetical protein